MQREITQEMAKDRLPRREADANKGSFGSVLAAAGSMAYRGAAALCTEGALRAGAGLVYLASVEPVVQMVLTARTGVPWNTASVSVRNRQSASANR